MSAARVIVMIIKSSFKIRVILSAFLITSLLFMAASCSRSMQSEEDLIKAMIDEVVVAVEKKDLKSVMKNFSSDYRDEADLDRDAMKRFIFYHFLKSEKITVFLRSVKIGLGQSETPSQTPGEAIGEAIVDIEFIVVKGKEVKSLIDLLPEDAAGIEATILMRKEGKSWKALSSRWFHVGTAGAIL